MTTQPVMSVILCTHNPRAGCLRRVLGSLQSQTLCLDQWELLLIDNASDQRLAATWDICWHPHGRHIREEEVGLTPSRLRGIREASGELLVYVDDDNVLASDFLERALAIWKQYPHLGVFGSGVLEPEFEVQPPPELVSRLSLLALRTVPHVMWSNNIRDAGCTPWGAGLCVTRRIATVYRELVSKLNVTAVIDRRGQQLFSGGDDLFSWASVRAGQGFGVFPELKILHLIPAVRLSRRYYLRLIYGHAFSQGIIHYLLCGVNPGRTGLYWWVRLFLHGVRNGAFSMRFRLARARGEKCAADFIARRGLRPLDDDRKSTPPGQLCEVKL